jgi:hypothetical protein
MNIFTNQISRTFLLTFFALLFQLSNTYGFAKIISLTAASGSYSDETLIRLENQATFNFDSNWDAYKLSSGGYTPTFGTILNGISYSINSVPLNFTDYTFQLNLKIAFNGAYTITTKQVLNSYDSTLTVTLEDKLLNVSKVIGENFVYKFTANTKDLTTRFVLHYKYTPVITPVVIAPVADTTTVTPVVVAPVQVAPIVVAPVAVDTVVVTPVVVAAPIVIAPVVVDTIIATPIAVVPVQIAPIVAPVAVDTVVIAPVQVAAPIVIAPVVVDTIIATPIAEAPVQVTPVVVAPVAVDTVVVAAPIVVAPVIADTIIATPIAVDPVAVDTIVANPIVVAYANKTNSSIISGPFFTEPSDTLSQSPIQGIATGLNPTIDNTQIDINAVSNQVFVKLGNNNQAGYGSIGIVNMEGKLVYMNERVLANSSTTISLNDTQPGIYIVKVISGANSHSSKVFLSE